MQVASATKKDSAALPIEARNLRFRFGSNEVVRGVDLDVKPGEIVSLLGPNGAGKTTTVRLILGLLRPASGMARVFGLEPTDPRARRRVGALLQIAKVPETLTVAEHARLFASYYGLDRSTIPSLLERLGLADLTNTRFGRLSGGQQRRVLFALASCGAPDILILDEPTVGLDLEARRALRAEIRDSADRGNAVLLTTHDLAEVDALADRVIVLNQGQILAEGSPRQIKDEVAARRLRCRTRLDNALIRARPEVRSLHRDGSAVELLVSNAEGLARFLLDRDPELTDLEIGDASLEEAFLALTRAAKGGHSEKNAMSAEAAEAAQSAQPRESASASGGAS